MRCGLCCPTGLTLVGATLARLYSGGETFRIPADNPKHWRAFASINSPSRASARQILTKRFRARVLRAIR